MTSKKCEIAVLVKKLAPFEGSATVGDGSVARPAAVEVISEKFNYNINFY
jgi:hypothetical protein